MAKQAIIGCTVTAVIEHEDGNALSIEDISDAQEDLRYAIQQRVMREGFIEQADVGVESFEIPPRSQLSLFFISAENDHGDNLELFVWADNADETVAAWRQYYEGWDFPQHIQVRTIQTAPKRGAVDSSKVHAQRFDAGDPV